MQVNGLRLVHRGVVVLDDIDLEMAAGEFVVVTGEDGCGTSSLLGLLPGMLLEQPPGQEWSRHDVAGSLAPAAALAELGAAGLADREMWTLSGGERQRVRLAAVIGEPVLLLDEPLGYLDGSGVQTILAVLRARTVAGACVLAVCKGDERAYAAADRVLELAGGRLTSGG